MSTSLPSSHPSDSADSINSANTPLLSPPSSPSLPPEPPAHTTWIYTLTFCAGISGLLFGYDTASISGALLHLAPSLSTPSHPITTWDKSLITSSTSFGALFGGLIAGIIADRIGRRSVILLADIAFTIGALWQAFASGVTSMVIGRVIVGVAVGVASLIVPLYISELAPASHRGRLVVISVLFITLGQLLAYVVSMILEPPRVKRDLAWRLTLGLGGVPAVVQFGLMLLMPETPRWLMKHRGAGAAGKALEKVYGVKGEEVEGLVKRLASGIEVEGKVGGMGLREKVKLLWKVGGNRRALIIACMLQFLQQACGFNSMMYFSPTILDLLGVRSPTATAMLVALTNAIFTGLAFRLIDRIGRRRMLLHSLEGMFLGLFICSFTFFTLPPLSSSSSLLIRSTPSTTTVNYTTPPSTTQAITTLKLVTLLLGLLIFVASYAIGLGAIPWVCQSEMFKMEVRGVGTGAATGVNWAGNLVVAAGFLGVVETVGAGWCFFGFAVVVAAGWAWCKGRYPETKGLAMEEVEEILRDGWGVGGR